MIVLDAGGLYALLDSSDRHHRAAHAVLAGDERPLLLSPLVLAEADYLVGLRLGSAAARALSKEIVDDVYRLVPFDDEAMAAAAGIVDAYADMAIGITDAAVAATAARYRTVDLLTVDGHFRVIRPLWGDAFRLLPLDG